MPDAPIDLTSAKSTAVLAGDFSAFQTAQRADDRADREPLTPPAAPSPAPPAVQAASTDATSKPASEPAKPPKNADTRVQELLADRATERAARERAERRVAELEARTPAPDVKAAASSPAPVPDAEPDPTDATKYPDGQFDRRFLKDQARWEAKQEYAERTAAHEQQQRDAAAQQQQQARLEQHQTQSAAFRTRIETAQAADPAVLEAIDPQLLRLTPSIALPPGERPTFGHAVADVLLQSDDPIALARHFSDPAEVTRLSNLTPEAFYREIGRIEARLAIPAAVAAPPTSSKTPAPPPTLGRQPTTLVDDAHSAVTDGDFPRFQSAMRQRDRAART